MPRGRAGGVLPGLLVGAAGLGLAAAEEPGTDLTAIPPGREIRTCSRAFRVGLTDGSVREFREYDLRFKVDTGPLGHRRGRAALVESGRSGDRVTVVFASLEELKRLPEERC